MQPKPKHLSAEYAAQFQDAAVVAAYSLRPPYPAGVFAILAELITTEPRVALDVGCGTGDVARRMAPLVARLDAVDVSWRMIARGQALPGGDAANLRWIVGAAEEAPLEPPYGLITAGESLQWMEWSVLLPRLHTILAPGAYLALVERGEQPTPWSEDLVQLIVRYSTNRDFQPYALAHELESRGLFATMGQRQTLPMPFEQSIDDYVESIHSRNGFSRDRLPPEDAAAFDAGVRALVAPHVGREGLLHLQIAASVIWGLPVPS
jgi:SAM-dependent methyltransferase